MTKNHNTANQLLRPKAGPGIKGFCGPPRPLQFLLGRSLPLKSPKQKCTQNTCVIKALGCCGHTLAAGLANATSCRVKYKKMGGLAWHYPLVLSVMESHKVETVSTLPCSRQ